MPDTDADTNAVLEQADGPQLLCVAGKRGIIKVIDPSRRSLLLTLSGHGDEIYDVSFSPIDQSLLISASKDESIRLWNVMNATCVAIFAGHDGHRDSVLSVGWHPLGEKFVSAGMDTSIKVWSLEMHRSSISESHKYRNKKKQIFTSGDKTADRYKCGQNIDIKKKDRQKNSGQNSLFRTVHEQSPIFSTNKVHNAYGEDIVLRFNIISFMLKLLQTHHTSLSRQQLIAFNMLEI